MKKMISLLLAMVMVFSLATVAAADEYTTMTSVNMKKQYICENDGTTSPAENIDFKVKKVDIKENDLATWPADTDESEEYDNGGVTVTTLELTEGAANDGNTKYDVTINLPAYEDVGIYTYHITEVSNNMAGVDYFDDNVITLVVTVIEQNGQKVIGAVHTETPVSPSYDENSKKNDTFVNKYSAGSLAVSKKVTGLLGDTEKPFDITVTFTAPEGKTVGDEISYVVGTETKTISIADMADGTHDVTISLADGETVTFTNIPYGVEYEVEEADYTGEGYDDAEYDGKETGTIGAPSVSTEITNNKDGDVDTGIALDSAPYFLMLAVALFGMVALVSKKRYEV